MTTAERIAAIKERAKDRGVSMTRLCRLADVNYSSWFRWEAGDQEPRSSTLLRLEARLDKLK